MKWLYLILINVFLWKIHPSENIPHGLMIEFIREPSGVQIMDMKPEFTWIVPASCKSQTAYQLLVASSEENLRNDTGDIWNSGKVPDNNSVQVEFGGEALKPGKSYCWKVKIWDSKGKVTGYSESQSFKTGSIVNYLTTTNKFQAQQISPVLFKETTAGKYFIDFGKDAFGTLLLRIESGKEDTLQISLGEKLIAPLKIDDNPGGSIRYARIKLPVKPGTREYTVTLPRDQRNTTGAAVLLPDSFGVVMPFRYCEIEKCPGLKPGEIKPGEIKPGEIKPGEIKQNAFTYYFTEDNSAFSCSDTTLNQIWDICKYSMKATSFTGLYIDGDRERIPYEADAYLNQLGHYYTDREYSMARRTNEYFIDHPTWPTEWLLHTVPLFYNDYMFTGDPESVKRYYEELKHKTLYSIAREDGLISSRDINQDLMIRLGFNNRKETVRDIVDWPPAQKDTGWKLVSPEGERDGYDMAEVNTMVNAFYYHGLVYMADLAGYLGKTGDKKLFSEMASMAKKSINEKLLSKKTGIYVDGLSSEHSSLHANMTTLAFGLVPDENRAMVISFIKSRGMACSVYGSQYLLEGLYRYGEADYAMKLLTSKGDRGWWNMIRSGSTITLEAWDMKYKPNSDWNHAW
ncbi:MAG TPA: hypothetical protein VK155_14020, partial [Bacteroidales bacterium]|nr:hypothetical protein [Bacteroidales bacterium]